MLNDILCYYNTLLFLKKDEKGDILKNLEKEIPSTESSNKKKKSYKEKPTRQRVHFLDEIRGFCIIAMVLYHAFFSMTYVFDISFGNTLLSFFYPVQPFFAGIFVALSGISSMLSRNNYVRGIKLFVIAMLVTLVTVIFTPGIEIKFGILHFLAVAMVIFQLCKKLLTKIPVKTGFIIFFLLFVITYNIPLGYIGFKPFLTINLPSALYSTNFLFPLGFPNASFFSSDYFSIIPWIFLFISGSFLGVPISKGDIPELFYKNHVPFLTFLGKHSLVIYIAHQPVIFGIFYILQMIL